MDSCFSCGNTSRNHPTQPATMKIATRMLTEALVTNPANTNVSPKARMIGHAVGAGSSIVRGACSPASRLSISDPIFQFLLLSSNHVNDRKNHNPHGIHEVPVQRQDVNTFSVLWSHVSQKREHHNHEECYKPYNDVKAVQSDQRVIGCSEQVRADRQSLSVNQPVPLGGGPIQESGAQCDGGEPQDSKTSNTTPAK